MRDWSKGRDKVDSEKRCRACGGFGNLEAAHVIPRSLGGRMDRDSMVPLCRSCHNRYDSGALDLLPHLTKEEQAEAVLVLGIERARARITGEYSGPRAA